MRTRNLRSDNRRTLIDVNVPQNVLPLPDDNPVPPLDSRGNEHLEYDRSRVRDPSIDQGIFSTVINKTGTNDIGLDISCRQNTVTLGCGLERERPGSRGLITYLLRQPSRPLDLQHNGELLGQWNPIARRSHHLAGIFTHGGVVNNHQSKL